MLPDRRSRRRAGATGGHRNAAAGDSDGGAAQGVGAATGDSDGGAAQGVGAATGDSDGGAALAGTPRA
jgi:hypothetical protein